MNRLIEHPAFWVIGGALAVLALGTMLVSPMGPGSSRPIFLLLVAYFVCVTFIVPRQFRVVIVVLLTLSAIGVAFTTVEKNRFEKNLEQQPQQRDE